MREERSGLQLKFQLMLCVINMVKWLQKKIGKYNRGTPVFKLSPKPEAG